MATALIKVHISSLAWPAIKQHLSILTLSLGAKSLLLRKYLKCDKIWEVYNLNIRYANINLITFYIRFSLILLTYVTPASKIKKFKYARSNQSPRFYALTPTDKRQKCLQIYYLNRVRINNQDKRTVNSARTYE